MGSRIRRRRCWHSWTWNQVLGLVEVLKLRVPLLMMSLPALERAFTYNPRRNAVFFPSDSAPRPDAPCARGVRLCPDDRRPRGHRRSVYTNAGSYAYVHTSSHPHPNAYACPHGNPNSHCDAYANPNVDADTHAYCDSNSHVNAHCHADSDPFPIPVDHVSAGVVARRRADHPRCLRSHPDIGDVRVGAAQQARCR